MTDAEHICIPWAGCLLHPNSMNKLECVRPAGVETRRVHIVSGPGMLIALSSACARALSAVWKKCCVLWHYMTVSSIYYS